MNQAMVILPDEEKVRILGRAYSVEYARNRHALPRIIMEPATIHEVLSFPWNRLPDDPSKIFFQDEELCIHVRVPDQQNFCCYSFADLRRFGREYCWRFRAPVGSDPVTLNEFREFREAERQQVAQNLQRYREPVYLLDLKWSARRSGWQASRDTGDYRVVYTVNERHPHVGTRLPGKYVCYLNKARAVEHPPKEGRQGFRLNVVHPPRLKVLDDLREFQVIINRQNGKLP